MPKQRLLVLGVGPLPHEDGEKVMAPGFRLDAIARRLAAEGHEITVGRALFDDVAAAPAAAAAPSASRAQASTYSRQAARGTGADLPYAVRRALPGDPELLRIWHDEVRFGAVVALSDVLAHAALHARLPIPLLADTYGDPFAERQMQAFRVGDDLPVWNAFELMLPVLLGADRFSVCSEDQHSCLLGQLGLVGRLNRHTAATSMVDVVRPSWPFGSFPGATPDADAAPLPPPLADLPADAIVLLWAGGYNNWTDVETLAAAVDEAMAREPRLRFVSAGGAIPGHAEKTYARLEALVAASPHRDRWHLLGWRAGREMPALYRRADLAVNIDAPGVEGRFGSRSRLLDWAHFGVATATTTSCELARDLVAAGGAVGFGIGDAAGLREALLRLATDAAERDRLTASARAFLAEWDARAVPDSFLAWCADPRPAPDLPSPAVRRDLAVTLPHPDNPVGSLLDDLRQSGWMRGWREDHGSRLYRVYRGARKCLASIRRRQP